MPARGCRSVTGAGWLLVVAAVLGLFWSHAFLVPYWQDDYVFLLDAASRRQAGEPWYSAFRPDALVQFWRPLGAESYWRLIEGVFGGQRWAAHAANLLLLVLAALSVGGFAATLDRRLHPDSARPRAAALAALLYGLHASHFLPAVWPSAASDSLYVLFSALTLQCWVVGITATGHRQRACLLLVPPGLLAALLSKEIAIVLPALGLLLALWLRPRRGLGRLAGLTGSICMLLTLAWYLGYRQFVHEPDPAYAMQLGLNTVRNAVSLLLFGLNTPREALRFALSEGSSTALLWGLVCALLQVLAVIMLLANARPRFTGRELLLLLVFALIGCGPYFLLHWNSYAYYTSLSLLAYAIIAVRAARCSPRLLVAVGLAFSSSLMATAGNYRLDYPSLLGRAYWAESQLEHLEHLRQCDPRLFSGRIYLRVENEHKFLGIGLAGLAYRLDLQPADITILVPEDSPPPDHPLLVIPDSGPVHFGSGQPQDCHDLLNRSSNGAQDFSPERRPPAGSAGS